MIGRNFRAFQVRYRDISRGGMRVVLPRNSGDYENALAGIFDEVNGLASAQQLKIKIFLKVEKVCNGCASWW